MRTRARIDGNHADIVKALRGIGASVQSLAQVGKGCPDIVVGRRGVNLLLEIKDGSRKPSEQSLTPDELQWHVLWNGKCAVVKSAEEAVKYVLLNT